MHVKLGEKLLRIKQLKTRDSLKMLDIIRHHSIAFFQ